jgi:hypothetical protein
MNRLMIQAALCVVFCPLLTAQQPVAPASAPTEASNSNVLKKGTYVRLVLLETVSSATATKGQSVRMLVKEDVSADGVIVIPKGTSATGIVAWVRKAVPGKKDGSFSITESRIIE